MTCQQVAHGGLPLEYSISFHLHTPAAITPPAHQTSEVPLGHYFENAGVVGVARVQRPSAH